MCTRVLIFFVDILYFLFVRATSHPFRVVVPLFFIRFDKRYLESTYFWCFSERIFFFFFCRCWTAFYSRRVVKVLVVTSWNRLLFRDFAVPRGDAHPLYVYVERGKCEMFSKSDATDVHRAYIVMPLHCMHGILMCLPWNIQYHVQNAASFTKADWTTRLTEHEAGRRE